MKLESADVFEDHSLGKKTMLKKSAVEQIWTLKVFFFVGGLVF
jgi:hypothetical protein